MCYTFASVQAMRREKGCFCTFGQNLKQIDDRWLPPNGFSQRCVPSVYEYLHSSSSVCYPSSSPFIFMAPLQNRHISRESPHIGDFINYLLKTIMKHYHWGGLLSLITNENRLYRDRETTEIKRERKIKRINRIAST